MSRTFLNAIGCLLFIGGCMAFVYMIGTLIESAREAML